MLRLGIRFGIGTWNPWLEVGQTLEAESDFEIKSYFGKFGSYLKLISGFHWAGVRVRQHDDGMVILAPSGPAAIPISNCPNLYNRKSLNPCQGQLTQLSVVWILTMTSTLRTENWTDILIRCHRNTSIKIQLKQIDRYLSMSSRNVSWVDFVNSLPSLAKYSSWLCRRGINFWTPELLTKSLAFQIGLSAIAVGKLVYFVQNCIWTENTSNIQWDTPLHSIFGEDL